MARKAGLTFVVFMVTLAGCGPAAEELVLAAEFHVGANDSTTLMVESAGLNHGTNVVELTASENIDLLLDLRTTDGSLLTVHDGDFIQAFDCQYLINASEYRCRRDWEPNQELTGGTWEVVARNSSDIASDLQLYIWTVGTPQKSAP